MKVTEIFTVIATLTSVSGSYGVCKSLATFQCAQDGNAVWCLVKLNTALEQVEFVRFVSM